jgi:ATP-dependent Clp protease ATP-binding subunit ClpA
MNGYNFTERVRRVLANSRAAAVTLNHEYVGTEHILVGLAEETEGVSAAVLEHLGVNREAIIAKVRDAVTPGADTRVGPRGNMITPSGRSELPYTSRAKKVLELSMGEARMLQHSYVGTEHLLLGLIAEDNGIGAQILKEVGATLEKARAATFAIVGSERVHPTPPDALIAHPTAPGYARSRSPYGVALVDDFTGRARDALRAAFTEAQSRDHGAVELSHVLLALASRADGMAAVLLDQVVGSRKRVVEALVERLPDKEENAARRTLQISAETQQALDNALIEASKDGHRRAGTQHLLLAVLDVLPLALAAACAQLGLTAKATRTVYERMRE